MLLTAARRHWRSAVGLVASVFLTVLVLAVLVLLTPLPDMLGWHVYVVRSGSMEPALAVGGMIATRAVPANDLHVGDVITFADQDQPGVEVTHRVVALNNQDGQLVATTKGDANDTVDSWSVPIDASVGRVQFSAPYLGYVSVWETTVPGKLTLLLVGGLLLTLSSLRDKRPRVVVAQAPKRPRTVEELAADIRALLALPSDSPE